MPDDDVVLRSARNAFLVMLVLLVGLSTYQFYTTGGISTPVAILWVGGAGVYYLSKYRYRRGTEKD